MPTKTITLEMLRAHALHRTMWQEKSLSKAIRRIGFLQADPIRAPARAQDLILRPRVKNYLAGTLEEDYPKLKIEEEYFVNYGFLAQQTMSLTHPKKFNRQHRIEKEVPGLNQRVLEYVRENEPVHPRQLQEAFGKMRVSNYWGGNSQGSTRALESLHHHGLLRVAKRENGIKVFGIAKHTHAPMPDQLRAEKLVQLLLQVYAPLPLSTLKRLVSMLGHFGVPNLRSQLLTAFENAKKELPQVKIDKHVYVWPHQEKLITEVANQVKIVAPFDPLVWDRNRFEHFHGWEYKFEAYTPAPRRQLGYYALPLFWQDKAVGWANVQIKNDKMNTEIGYVQKPKEREFKKALEEEIENMRFFLSASKIGEVKILSSKPGAYQLPGSQNH